MKLILPLAAAAGLITGANSVLPVVLEAVAAADNFVRAISTAVIGVA